MSQLCGGVETGGTWCVCALGRGPDEILAEERFATSDPRATLERVVDFFRRGPAPAAIGIGAFGPVDLRTGSPTWGHVTTTPKPGWQHASVAPVIRDALGVPVVFEHDVTAAAVGEHRWGAARDAPTLCYLTVGTGIGAGLLVEGRPLHGLVHPEVGHIRVPHDPRRDPYPGRCPVHGDCWEGLACGPAIAERWQVDPGELPDQHPAWALEAHYLALGILSLVLIVSPQRVIVGGGVMQRPGLLDQVKSRLRNLVGGYLQTPLLKDRIDDYLAPPGLGERSGVLGGIALAQDALEGGRATGELSPSRWRGTEPSSS